MKKNKLYLVVILLFLTSIIDPQESVITNKKQITFEGPKSGEGYFSADGKKMIFQSERDPKNPFYQMFVMNLETGSIDRISTGSGKTTCGWIHPDEKKAMWSSTHLDTQTAKKVKEEFAERAKPVKGRYSWSFDDQFDIFESDLKGQNIKRLTKEKGYDAEGSYSPNGKQIAFASNRRAYQEKLSEADQKKLAQDASYFMDIYIMNADGTNVRRLTTANGYDGGPFFSADGKKITWRRFSESGASAEIYTMNVDGSEQKQITRLNSMSWAPYFHASGDYIIFSTTVGGYSNFELMIVDANGKKDPVRVTFAEGFDGLASFSPDGKKITWSHKNEKGESQIYLADWNDSEARKLLGIKEKVVVAPVEELTQLKPEIQTLDIKNIVNYLASEKMNGRFTGSEEEKVYTAKIADLFKAWGLVPAVGNNFIQEFEFVSGVTAGVSNTAQFVGRFEQNLIRGIDYQALSYSKSGNYQSKPVVFAGYGIVAPATTGYAGYDSYKNLDVTGKWVILLDEAPRPSQKEFAKHTHILTYSRLQHKITVAKNKGAYGVIVVQEGKVGDLKFGGSLSDSQLPLLKLQSSVFDKILKAGQLKTYSEIQKQFETYDNVPGFALPSQYFAASVDLITNKSIGRNVIGVLKDNKTIKNKAVLIGAHGDHLGLGQVTGSSLASSKDKDQIHYGADDNASGVAGVLELAHNYSQNKNKIQRPIYFAVWSGEEIGVLGSNHFVKSIKNFSKKFEAGLNMDMIGRLAESLNVQGVGSAQGWKQLSEKISVMTDTPLNLTTDPYLPTDAMAIYLGDVPSISFFTGAHSEYHTPRDKPDTLNYNGLFDVIHVVKLYADAIVETNKSFLKYEKVGSETDKKMEGRSFRIFLGTIPDYSQEGVKGVRISGVAKNSPAEKAGLKSGDIITEFDQTKIENIYDYVYVLQSVKPSLKTNIKISRNQKSETLEITPALKD